MCLNRAHLQLTLPIWTPPECVIEPIASHSGFLRSSFTDVIVRWANFETTENFLRDVLLLHDLKKLPFLVRRMLMREALCVFRCWLAAWKKFTEGARSIMLISQTHKSCYVIVSPKSYETSWEWIVMIREQTFWTVEVSSRHSWMILFLVEVKSLIPVREVLLYRDQRKDRSRSNYNNPNNTAIIYLFLCVQS